MKRLLALLLCTLFVFSACTSSETAVTTSDATSSSEHKSEPDKPLDPFYEMAHNDNRPIAVMIDNDNEDSRPQIGLEDAYIVYEIIVEGGASRMMALFKNYDVEKVGPVRSSRHYFLDYALENDAIYAHAGWSPLAQRDIPALGINNINGILGDDGSNFWRDYTYDRTYHNLYTSVKKLSEYAKNTKKYSTKASEPLLEMNTETVEPSGDVCNEVSFSYSAMYGVGFKYDPATGLYERSVNRKPHMSQTGKAFTAKNIIIYNVSNYPLNDGQNKDRQDIRNIGTGNGWYISMGKAQPITWTKDARGEKTLYLTDDGKELHVNPGTTYIQIIPADSKINMQ